MGAKVKGIPVKVYGISKVTAYGIPKVTAYGIPNCDQVKKARAWLEANKVDYTFHDFKKQGLSSELAANWLGQAGAGRLINRKGTTWRALDEMRKTLVDKASSPASVKIKLMLDHPSVIKRPVLDVNGAITVGFNPDQYRQLFP